MAASVRSNRFYYALSLQPVDGDFIIGQMEAFSLALVKPAFLVLDNAPVHKTKKMRQHIEQWQQRGLYIFYLPPYSPHLNIAETLWRVMKGKWIEVKDYLRAETLFEAVRKCLGEAGTKRTVNCSPFTINYFVGLTYYVIEI